MGFLKFLKKSKKDKLEMPFEEDLDIPPPPPVGIKEELPPTPDFDQKYIYKHEDEISARLGSKIEIPSLPKFKENIEYENKISSSTRLKDEFPPLPEFEEKIPDFLDVGPIKEIDASQEIPRHPQIPKFEEKLKPPIPQEPVIKPSRPKPKIPQHEAREISPFERMGRSAVREERRVLRHENVPLRPIFIRVEGFREVRRSISIVRNDLKSADDILIKLQDIKDVKDKEFSKWQKTMEDVQKKLIFIDKTLFKGD